MTRSRRVARLNELLREELSRLVRTEVKDPRVGDVTITRVRVTPDLMHAAVHVRTLVPGDEEALEEALLGLRRAEGFLRRCLGRELHLRRIPELRFEADRSLEHARHIESLLEEAMGPPGADEPDAT